MANGFCSCGQPARAGQRYCDGCHAFRMRIYRAAHPPTDKEKKKSNCRSYLHVYIKRGKIAKGPCVVCGATEQIEGHHEDYSKPLEVIWLCRGHHVLVTRGLLDLADFIKKAGS